MLTLHDVAKVVSLPAGADRVTVKAEFAIDRKDFGIVYPGKPDNLIADEVLMRVSISAK